MKRSHITYICGIFMLSIAQLSHAQKEEGFGRGFARVSYVNVHNCKVEFQSFDSTITEAKLNGLMPFLYRIGSKDNGMENVFPTYRVYDFTKNSDVPEKLTAFAKKSVKEFEKVVSKLKATPVPKEFEAQKAELVKHYTKRLEFEKIVRDWYVSGNDAVFRKQVTSYYTDIYVTATLDKTLALKGIDRMRYSYVELYDIMYARIFPLDNIQRVQNKLLHDYKIEIVVDAKCTKS